MWQKIKCWLGFHTWFSYPYTCRLKAKCWLYAAENHILCKKCEFNRMSCVHCGKVKR